MEGEKGYRIHKVDELQQLAMQLLQRYPDARIFAIYGPMGVGKTTFIKYLCQLLGVSDLVSSPSYPIVNHYITDKENPIYHFDFYRIKTHEEVYDLGYEDYFYSGNYCFVEWPEKVEPLLPEDAIHVFMELDQERRLVRF